MQGFGISRMVSVRQGKIKGSSFIHMGLGPNGAAVFSNDAIDGRQANTGAFEFVRPVQTLKDAE